LGVIKHLVVDSEAGRLEGYCNLCLVSTH